MGGQETESKLGFLDSLTRLFRKDKAAPSSSPQAEASRFEELRLDFEAALRGLNEKVEEQLSKTASTPSAAGGRTQTQTAGETRAAERARRIDTAHREIREDIEKMHERLGTGFASADFDEVARYLEELEATETAGKDSHELLPRARYAITDKLGTKAGELAVARLIELLQRAKLSWPDPTHYHRASEADIERSQRRRQAEVRETFLAQGMKRTAERLYGIVSVWGSDYPDRASALWEETVLEGVAAGIRGQLIKEFVELLRGDRDVILSRTEEVIGKELSGLQQVLEGGVRSIEQANLAVASALRVLDQVVPELAWEHVQSRSPRARGEWAS